MNMEITSQLREALRGAERRARKHGLDIDIDLDFVQHLYREQAERCILSGIQFRPEAFSDTFVKRPFAPSLDRIDPRKGYTRDNVRLLCTAVNFARGQWGDDVLVEIAHGIVEKEREDHAAWYRQKQAELKAEKRKLTAPERFNLARVKSRIAGLKATITKGPARLRSAARRAKSSR